MHSHARVLEEPDSVSTRRACRRSGWRSFWPTVWSAGRCKGSPLALSIFGNASLIAVGRARAVVVVVRRRREWSGSQRLFWDVIAVSMTLWIVGHVGWAYDQMISTSSRG